MPEGKIKFNIDPENVSLHVLFHDVETSLLARSNTSQSALCQETILHLGIRLTIIATKWQIKEVFLKLETYIFFVTMFFVTNVFVKWREKEFSTHYLCAHCTRFFEVHYLSIDIDKHIWQCLKKNVYIIYRKWHRK